MRKRRNPIAQAAALLTRGAIKLVDTSAKIVKGSTQGVRDLYSEAKSEYESGRASVRTVGSPIVMPGASHSETSSSLSNLSTGAVSTAGSSLAGSSTPGTASPILLDQTGAPLETGVRKRGRPKKAVLAEAFKSAPEQSSGILLADGSPATKQKLSSTKGSEPAAGKRRGRPVGTTQSLAGAGSSSITTFPAKRGPKPGATSRKKTSSILELASLDSSAPSQPVSQLDGTSEAPVVPDDLTPAAVPAHKAVDSGSEASVE